MCPNREIKYAFCISFMFRFLFNLHVGIGVPLVQMTIEKVELLDQVVVRMFQRRKMLVDQIPNVVALVTLL